VSHVLLPKRLTLKTTPQTVLFNDEDFHSVEILETVVRQSVVLAHRKKCLPEHSTKYFALLIARVQMLFTFLSVPFVASKTLASLNNAWMDTEVTLQKDISLPAPTGFSDCLVVWKQPW
jgi:hypothetical protein